LISHLHANNSSCACKICLFPIKYVLTLCSLSEPLFRRLDKAEMSVRRRGEAKQANGSANGSIKHENVVDLKTDHTRWRMKNVDGRQTWHYLESDDELKAWPMTSADKYYLGMDTVSYNMSNECYDNC